MPKIAFCLLLFLMSVSTPGDFDKAVKCYQSGDLSQAKSLFEKLVADNPKDVKSIEFLGDIEGRRRSWDRALVYYGRLRKLNPSEANYCYKYGGALGMKAKESNKFTALSLIGEVRSSFEKAIQLNPRHIEARWALIELYLQLPGIVGGSEAKASRYAEELLKISPVDGYLAKGRIAEYFERYPTAERYYQKAVDIGGSKTSYQKLADLYKNKMNQPEKARAILAESSQKHKS